MPIAVARSAGVLGNAIVVALPGELVGVNFASAPASSANGSPVFLSPTPGQATLVPTFGSGRVIYVVGTLTGADGATTTPTVAFNPQFLSHRL